MGVGDSIMDFITGGNSSRAAKYAKQGLDVFNDINAPTAEELQSIVEGYVQQGQLSPEMAQAFLQDPSAMTSISTDPAFKDAQMNALTSLQDLSKGGFSAQDKADLSRISIEEQAKARGAREAVLQNAAERGAGGGGLALLDQMKANQDAASRSSQRDLDVAGMAQQRALAALQAAGNQAGNMQAQEFGQKAQVAGSQDAISKFNASQSQAVNAANIAARNQAAASNLAAKQAAADSVVNARNQTAANKAGAQQSAYDNTLKKASGLSGAYNSAANQATAQGQALSSLLGTGITAAATLYNKKPNEAATASDRNLKEDIEGFDPGNFLDSLTGYKYNYKDGHGLPPGKQVGVMAQDVEKEVPNIVEETPDGKMIDFNKSGGAIFASMGDLHRRLKALEGN